MERRRMPALIPLLALAVLWIAFPPIAGAARLPAHFLVLKPGGYFPRHGDVDTFDAGASVEFAYGHVVAPGLAFELGAGYFRTEGPSGGPPGEDREFAVVPVILTVKGLYSSGGAGGFEAFASAGAGVYFIRDEIREVGGASHSDRDAEVGFHLGAGAQYNATRNLFLGLEGRYLFLSTSTFGLKTRLDGIVLSGRVGYRF
jgi:opacity protein-like surface antigen